MEAGALQDRLTNNAKAFDGLLSLIPGKLYYGEDITDQWKRKKQSKAEAKAARRGKLDPDSARNRNAKEVMEERAKKRKLQEISDSESEASTDAEFNGIEKEKPGEGLLKHDGETAAKKQKVSKAKRAKKTEKRTKSQEKEENSNMNEAEASTEETPATEAAPENSAHSAASSAEPPAKKDKKATKESKKEIKKDLAAPSENPRINSQGPSPLPPQEEHTKPTPQSSPNSDHSSPTFDQSPQTEQADIDQDSVDTSVNEGNPDAPAQKRAQIKVPDPNNMEIFRERLHVKLAAFREARGAGPNGKPVRSREDLIEARRLEQAKKKAQKQELRRRAKEEEEKKREEALKAASSRSSPLGSMSPSIHGDANFSFGRVTFSDGAQMSRDLTYVLKDHKKKGPSDPKTALAKVETQKARIAAMDEDKRKDVLEKETWLAARKRAEGEKVKDDETLLKKAIKRKEKAKKKSEKAWKERTTGVEQAMKAKQQKREDNLRKRREDKALGKLGKKAKKSKSNKKVAARPGFEGNFKIGGGRKK